MNSRSAERKRRLLILRNQQVSVPGLYPRPETDASEDQVLIEEFRVACGTRGLPRLSVGDAEDSSHDCFVLEKPYAVLGRSPDSDIRLTDADVSFRHAYLQLVNGRLLCVDLASSTGTYFGERARHSAWLDAGVTASIGPYVLHCLGDQQDVFGEAEPSKQTPQSDRPHLTISNLSQPDEPCDRPAHLPNVSLVFLNARRESSRKRVRRITRPVTLVGGSRVCKLTLADKTVSRVHCSFVLTPQGLWIVDLLGRGGTKVDGDLIEHRRLDDGSEISVGRFRFRVRYDAQESPQTSAVATPSLSAFPSSPTDEVDCGSSSMVTSESAIVIADDGSIVSALSAVGDDSSASRTDTNTKNVPTPVELEPAKPATAVAVPEEANPSKQFSEQFVLSLIEQFSVMQQQMFDQTQQQMLILTQMFGAMYQSQQDLVRTELQQIHSLTTEMQHIQSRLLEAQVATDKTRSLPPPNPAAGQNKSLTAETDPPSSVQRDSVPPDNIDNETESIAATAPLTAEPETVPPTEISKPADAGEPTDAAECSPDEPSDDDTPDSADLADKPPRTRADVDSHAWLAERMSQLERERSSRWKKIMQTLSGAGS